MAVVQLASSADVADALGRALTSDETARVDAILDKASELFRLESGQYFTAGTSTVRLRAVDSKVELEQRPVVSVTSVTDDDGVAVVYELSQSTLKLTDVTPGQFVQVEYTHGGVVPDLVRLTVAEVAKKVLSIAPKAVAGVVQHSETTGPFTDSDTYATWAQGGQTMLAPADVAIARKFRRSRGFRAAIVMASS